MVNEIPDWTTAETIGMIAAEELAAALALHDILFQGIVYNVEDDRVVVMFQGIHGVETLLALAIDGDRNPGSLYDRATAGCVSLNAMDDDVSYELMNAAIRDGWTWEIHPDMTGRMVSWHVRVDMPVADANTITASLNCIAGEEL